MQEMVWEFSIKSMEIFARELFMRAFSRLSRPEKVILSLINLILLFTGGFFGVICELLLKAISARKDIFNDYSS